MKQSGKAISPFFRFERRVDARQGAAAVLSLVGFFVALTLPGMLVSCSPSGRGYAEGFAAWRVMTMLSSIVVIPLLLAAGLVASCISTTIPIPGNIVLISISTATLTIALLGWLTAAHVPTPNCFP
jgi:hypothetical protein